MSFLKKYQNTLFVAVITAVALIFSYWPIVYSASENIRIIDAFNTDEVDFLRAMLDAYNANSFDINRYEYGLLYYNIGLIFFNIVGFFTPITEQVGVIIMRLLSSGFLIGTALVSSKLLRDKKLYTQQLVFLLILLSSIALVNYGTMLHPDLAQVFFVTLSLFYLSKYVTEPTIKTLVYAVLSAGFAFSTKYVGIALLPIIWLLVFIYEVEKLKNLSRVKRAIVLTVLALLGAIGSNPDAVASYLPSDNEISSFILSIVSFCRILCVALLVLGGCSFFLLKNNQFVKRLLNGAILSLGSFGVFTLGFSIGSPQGIKGFNFLNGIVAVASVHKDGHWFRDDSGFIGWIKILVDNEVVPVYWSLLACVGILLVFYHFIKNRDTLSIKLIIPFAWIVMFCFVVVFRVKSHFAHYLIPIIPFVLIYAALGIEAIVEKIKAIKAIPLFISNRLSALVTGVICVLGLLNAITYSNQRVEHFTNSAELKAGEWLKKNVHERAFITADKYTYIPKKENLNYRHYWGLSLEVIENDNPDYLVINKHTYSWFMNAADVDTYLHGRELFLERNKLYHDLENDANVEFKLVADFDEVKVYKKRPPNGDL